MSWQETSGRTVAPVLHVLLKERKIMRYPLLVLSTSLLLGAPALAAKAVTRTVPTQYPTIQSAVNAANPGDTVLVKGGTYNEQVLIQNNTNGVQLDGLSLVGTNGATLSGPGLQATVGIEVEANNVTVQGTDSTAI